MSETQTNAQPKSMRTFYTIWFGQVISMVGSSLTGFAMGVWMFETTGDATPFVMVALFSSLPPVFLSAFAGALVDRWDRRWVMIISDVGSALVTLVIFALFFTNQLEVWHLYITVIIGSIFNTFQMPAYSASMTMMVPKEQLARANGMVQTGQTFGGILAPVIAGALFGLIGIPGIVLIDFVTFFFAVGALLLVRIPHPEQTTPQTDSEKQSLWAEVKFGINYLSTRKGLLGLALFIALLNLMISSVMALSTPMILAFTDAATMGIIQSVGSVGMLFGGLLISTWGGPKGKINGIFIAAFISAIGLTLAGLQPVAWLIGLGYFIFLFPIPTVNALIRAIMQTKVPADIQGRIFSILIVLSRTGVMLGYLVSGPLVDNVFIPSMKTGGQLATWLGPIFGVGEGRGIGVMFVIAGLLMWVATGVMYAVPSLRNIERDMPDILPDEPAIVAEQVPTQA